MRRLNSLQTDVEGVENLLSLCSFLDKNNSENGFEQFKDEQIYRLQALLLRVLSLEESFYNFMEVKNLKELNKKIEDIIFAPIVQAMKNAANTGFTDLVEQAKEGKGLKYEQEGIKTKLTFFLGEGDVQNKLSELGFENASTDLKDILVQALHDISSSDGTLKTVRVNAGIGKDNRGRGLSNILVSVVRNEKKDKNNKLAYEVVLRDDRLPREWKKRLEDSFGFEYEMYEDTSLNIIINYLQRYNDGSPIAQAIMRELQKFPKEYDINKSIASIAGFLGEVRTNAILSIIGNGKFSRATATGTIRELASGAEIPIDLVIKDMLLTYGFQVKNYREINGSIRLGKRKAEDSMKIENFIDGRLKSTHSGILKALYASYQYNVTQEGSDFSSIRSQIESYATIDSKDYFDTYIDNIIKISQEFQTNNEDGIFGDQQLYFNTFFVVGDKFIPSSAIIYALIDSLRGTNKDLILSKYIISQGSDGPQFPEKAGGKFYQALHNVNINYNIIIQIDRIFNSALNAVNNKT